AIRIFDDQFSHYFSSLSLWERVRVRACSSPALQIFRLLAVRPSLTARKPWSLNQPLYFAPSPQPSPKGRGSSTRSFSWCYNGAATANHYCSENKIVQRSTGRNNHRQQKT